MVKGSEGVFFNYLGNIVKPDGGEYWSILRISMCEDLEKTCCLQVRLLQGALGLLLVNEGSESAMFFGRVSLVSRHEVVSAPNELSA